MSPGKAEGIAKIVARSSELERAFRLIAQGDILVTTSTDPAWTPIFPRLGGLVMERGGLLSHGAVVAREYGIPTVVGVDDATTRIMEGQSVLVDGHEGTVQLLD